MSDQDNPYSAPTTAGQATGGAVESTLAGQAELGFGTALDQGWKLVSGTKLIIVGGFLAFYVALFVVVAVLALVLGIPVDGGESTTGAMTGLLVQLVITAAVYPFMVGVLMVGIKQASGQSFSFQELFSHYDKVVPLLLGYLLMTVATMIGFLLLILPGIWLAIATILTPVLIAEKGMGPVDALLTSIKLVNKKWFTVFFTLLVVGILIGISAIPFGIGLIWTMPWSVMVMAVIYRQLAGIGTPAA